MVHEWALAEAIVEAVSRYASQHGYGSVRSVTVRVGELQDADIEVLRFALGELSRMSRVRIGGFRVEVEEAVFKCRACGHEWRLRDLGLSESVREAVHFVPEAVYAYARCPRCGSPDYEIVRGRGVYIAGIEVE